MDEYPNGSQRQTRAEWEILEEIANNTRALFKEVSGLGFGAFVLLVIAIWHFW